MATLLATGLAAVVAAGWAVFTYLNKSDAKAEVTYQLCVAAEPSHCLPKTVFVRGAGPDVISTWVNHDAPNTSRGIYGGARDLQLHCRAG